MQGVRWTEEDLKAHQARMAGHKPVPAAPAPVPADARRNTASGAPSDKPPHQTQRPEQDLQIAVAELLDRCLPRDWRWWHTPNQRGTRKAWEVKLLAALGVKPGVQDVTIVGPDQRLVIIELKSATGTLSKAQKDWRDYYLRVGIPWFLARSIDDVIAACADAGVPLRARAQ